VVGSDDTRIVEIARSFCERLAVVSLQLAEDDRPAGNLDGTCPRFAECPHAEILHPIALRACEEAEHEIVPCLILLQGGRVIGNEFRRQRLLRFHAAIVPWKIPGWRRPLGFKCGGRRQCGSW
jgi:hypothetical protein